jgi:GntR family transcriptional regulator
MAHEQNAIDRFGLSEPGLDPGNGIALYVQLAAILRFNVLSGVWQPGHRLDNFEVLAERFGVARITVRQAVARLVEEGLMTAQRGRGTFVRAVPGATPNARHAGASTDWASDLEVRFLYRERTYELPAEFRGQLEVFESYVEISKIHVMAGRPFAMVRVYVAEPVFRRFPRRAMERTKILRLVLAHGGESAETMRQVMTVEPADMLISRHLDYAVGSPVAKILRQVHGEDRRVSYAGLAWYRGDAFEMDITLPRSLVDDSAPSLIAPRPRSKAATSRRG